MQLLFNRDWLCILSLFFWLYIMHQVPTLIVPRFRINIQTQAHFDDLWVPDSPVALDSSWNLAAYYVFLKISLHLLWELWVH